MCRETWLGEWMHDRMGDFLITMVNQRISATRILENGSCPASRKLTCPGFPFCPVRHTANDIRVTHVPLAMSPPVRASFSKQSSYRCHQNYMFCRRSPWLTTDLLLDLVQIREIPDALTSNRYSWGISNSKLKFTFELEFAIQIHIQAQNLKSNSDSNIPETAF